MKPTIDTSANQLTVAEEGASPRQVPVYSTEGFEILSDLWVKVGWNQKYSYTFSWMGRPVIQLPEDTIRLQEVIWSVQPDVLIETGVAHGGSLIYYVSIFQAMNKGRVVGVDIEIRTHNRRAIEAHPMSHRITMIEGSSTDPRVVADARSHIKPGETTLIILDSNHTYQHVLDELRAYADMVTVGSYIVATDGLMGQVYDAPRGMPGWITDNPTRAARDFVAENRNFELVPPAAGLPSQLPVRAARARRHERPARTAAIARDRGGRRRCVQSPRGPDRGETVRRALRQECLAVCSSSSAARGSPGCSIRFWLFLRWRVPGSDPPARPGPCVGRSDGHLKTFPGDPQRATPLQVATGSSHGPEASGSAALGARPGPAEIFRRLR